MKFLFLLILLSQALAHANVCNLQQNTFKKVDLNSVELSQIQYGQKSDFHFTSTMTYRQRVLYYIPRSLGRDYRDASAVFFMHGGGGSTGGLPEGALRAANLYIDDLMRMSEKLKFVLFMPVSPLNWGGNTQYINRDLALIARNKFNINPDKIILAGHSMGGMGIGRSSLRMIDQFMAFMPLSSGIVEAHQVPIRLHSYFNTAYRRQQGTQDHFRDFLITSRQEEEKIRNYESILGLQADYKLTVYEGSHNYDRNLVERDFKELIENTYRNNYQPQLFANFGHSDSRQTIYQWDNLHFHNISEYFWLEVAEFFPLGATGNSFQIIAKMENNQVNLEFDPIVTSAKTMRIFLSQKMIDFESPITVNVNGEVKFSGHVTPSAHKTAEIIEMKKDKKFVFENCLDIELE